MAEARAILENPELAHIFGPAVLAEVPVVAPVDALGGQYIYGAVDRLIVADGRVTIVDFKTNRLVPDMPAATPVGILRQMGAYAAAFGQIYPDHEIHTQILWTKTAQLMPLPHDIVIDALRNAPTS